ncbi:bifunctional prephenate dehydrogenase/3-phosphoshikimate 1-carboxyvinyltransferase [Burkholderia pseudomallei]|uniref:3-phosphoshikimate 1-carboxyvinyltransferase n=1 Tax=Burkholderia pseudomallei (strain 1106a) TaxID=357348 RepID=A3NXX1_BURP0|nr:MULTISPECIES: 3-phosphoshikimate 1-carboxyvinyltransferase [pseudomallei group]KGV71060.1 3-phosphoshikimate 1-carboxyvinyltransferase [Burkholderia pseudomallei MSHR4375]KGW05891.1 3-phosphoshikimate 1-carboxyvinyltransferase [Burkholderia pseudomallei TSV 25]KGX19599.1 3-phosphoshikimate 1-carboxyvinyltransferase [Burkholderia pseudomallei ABCPW 1]ABN90360.1 prephenate dehydrogenase/3-phosphoshikimate 1-carboxyvinyltransferase [Burkholderia pseudomallei 1106a]AFR16838.1 bifunctional preph
MSGFYFDKLVIFGVGLIGGSLALALREGASGGRREVVGVGRSSASIGRALALRVIDRAAALDDDAQLRDALAGADLVLLAAPVAQTGPLLARIAPFLDASTIVTDAGSTKSDVVAAARAALGARIGQFVPGHPIAGRESSGVDAALADLYVGRNVVLCALPENAPDALARVEAMWRAARADVRAMSAEQHDRVFAAVSHLPHVLSFALVEQILGESDAELKFSYAAGGFRDFTRIAASSPEMWRDVCLANRAALLDELDAYTAVLARLRAAIDAGDGAALEAVFARSRAARAAWRERGAKPAPAVRSDTSGTGSHMEHLDLGPFSHAQGTVRLPGSKSISNRVLLLAALAEGETTVTNLLDSDDTRVMLDALTKLGVKLSRDGGTCVVGGTRGAFTAKTADLFLGNAGTAVRPLTAALAVNGGEYRIHGVPRMHERPIGDLVDGLRQIGARIDYEGNEGFPPLRIRPATISVDAPIRVRGDVSSQFLTALLMTLPLVKAKDGASVVEIDGELISKPYIEITIKLMARFGVTVERDGWQRFTVPAGVRYRSPGTIMVEGDASSASYFLAAGALGGGPLRVEGVGRASIQGDVGFANALMQMGANVTMGDDWIEVRGIGHDHGRLAPIDMDFNLIPDAAMTIAVAALFADGPSTLRNIGSWRVKETDRIAAMATELRKVGATVEEGADYLVVTPPAQLTPNASIDTYDDHRMAMCFSLVSLGGVPVRINDPKCVGKTFPDYFDRFLALANA